MTRITDEAIQRLRAYLADPPQWDELASRWDQETGIVSVLASDLRLVLDALEADLPHLEGATPVASRERLAEVIDPAAFDQTKKRSKQPAAVIQWAARQHMAFVAADRLIAAGAFREGATPAIDREALLQVVAEYIDDLDAVPPMGTSAEHLERRAVHVTDAVIAHLGGGAS